MSNLNKNFNRKKKVGGETLIGDYYACRQQQKKSNITLQNE